MPRRSAEATVSFLLSSRAVGCWACWPDAGSTNAKESKAIAVVVRLKKYQKESFMACSWNRSVARRKLRTRRTMHSPAAAPESSGRYLQAGFADDQGQRFAIVKGELFRRLSDAGERRYADTLRTAN